MERQPTVTQFETLDRIAAEDIQMREARRRARDEPEADARRSRRLLRRLRIAVGGRA